MKVARIVVPVFLLVALVTAYLVVPPKEDDPPPPLDDRRATDVMVSEAEPHRGTVDIHVDGQVVPYREIDLSAEVAGRITFKADEARAGRFVREGEVLFGIDDRDYKLAVARLQKQLEQAGVAIEELDEEIAGAQRLVELGKSQLALAQSEYDRQVDLHRRGVSADSERDKAQRDKITADNALTMVRNQHLLLRTRSSRLVNAQELLSLQIEKADHDLTRTIIQSPVDGVIVRDSVERDDFVNVGTPIVTIEDTSAVEVKCNLQMDELYWIWDQTGAPSVDVSQVGAGGGYQLRRTPAKINYRLQEKNYFWKGELWRIDGIGLDERTRTVPCRVIVDEPRNVFSVLEDGREVKADGGPPALVRGMYVDVEIEITPRTQLFRVPETAIKPGEKHEKIWLARIEDEDNSASGGDGASEVHKPHDIDVDIVDIVVDVDKDLREVRKAVVHAVGNDLLAGDQVLVMPLGKLHRGMRLIPVDIEGKKVRGKRAPGQEKTESPQVTTVIPTAPRNTSP